MRCPTCKGTEFVEHVSGDLICSGCGNLDPEWAFGDDDRLDAWDVEGDLIDELVLEQNEWR